MIAGIAHDAVWEILEHPGVGRYRMPGSPLGFSNVDRVPARRAPQLGEHTEAILADLLGLSAAEIGRLEASGVVRVAQSSSSERWRPSGRRRSGSTRTRPS
jgi:crotonobetainyl-CoA:carnitine CoA-transferase CaiB-like acyl-CoA transferase